MFAPLKLNLSDIHFSGDFCVKMLLLLELLLLLSGVVSDKAVECEELMYKEYCWSSQADEYGDCWQCFISNQQIAASDKELFTHNKFANGTVVDVGLVFFSGGYFPRMPKIIQETTKQPILAVKLFETNTRVLNEKFFGNAGESLTFFGAYENNELSVEAFAFQSCALLEALCLEGNKISFISPDAFVGLHKLIRLDLGINQLSLVNKGWFRDLSNLERLDLSFNDLEEIPEDSLAALTKLKRLNLYSNNIKIVSRNTFQHNEQLQFIDLKQNQIQQVQWETFTHLSQLTQLDLGSSICINNNFESRRSAKIAKALTACHRSICKIPQITNGYVINIEDKATQTPGVLLKYFDSVKVVCDPNFIQFHEKGYKCTKKDWKRQRWPTCERK